MKMSGFLSHSNAMQIVELSSKIWDTFALSSPQGTIYDLSFFHQAHGLPIRYWCVVKGAEIVAGFAAIEKDGSLQPLNFQNYSGMLYRSFQDYKSVTATNLIFESTSILADFLFKQYRTVYLYNHWGITDIRPFQWLNYNTPEQGGYNISVCYTVLMGLAQAKDKSSWQTLRRRDLLKANSAGLITKITNDGSYLDRLQSMTYARQGLTRTPRQEEFLPKIIDALFSQNSGKIFVTYSGDEPVAAALFSYDKYRAYFMVGGLHSDAGGLGAGTKLMADAFEYLHEKLSLHEIDLVGANSPSRSQFKLGFGGALQPLYQITTRHSSESVMSTRSHIPEDI